MNTLDERRGNGFAKSGTRKERGQPELKQFKPMTGEGQRQ